MNVELFAQNCCGCGACEAVCPKGAISMAPNEEGFLFPHIDRERCVSCGACTNVCQENPEVKCLLNSAEQVYACQAKDQKLLLEATAGALFPVLAEYVIEQGGYVYGAVYNDCMEVVHIGVKSKDDLIRFNGSKYVQSNTSGVFESVYANLEAGHMVLFSGTPCQIAALRLFCANVSQEKLITIDVVCYGVPSPKVFRAYLDVVEKKYRAKVTDFRFRDKHTYGWSHTTVIAMKKDNGEQLIIEQPDYYKIKYYRMFAHRDCFRKTCYSCRFNILERCSDFTTGNFWGIENISNAFDVKLGVSMLLINSEKGKQIFEKIKDRLRLEERMVEDAIRANDALVKGSKYPQDRDAIYRCFVTYGFSKTIRKFYSKLSKRQIVYRLYKIKKHIFGS